MKKYIKIIIAIIVVIVTVLLIMSLNKKTDLKEEVSNYIIQEGFLNDDNSPLYYKKLSTMDFDSFNKKMERGNDASYEMLYFNLDNFQYMKDYSEYKNDVYKSFNPTYSYKTNLISYNYRIGYNDTTVLIKGTYNKDSEVFECKPEYSYEIDISKSLSDICNKVKLDVLDFQYEADTLITNANLLKKMKNYNPSEN